MVQQAGRTTGSPSRLGRWLGRQHELVVAPSSRWLLVSVLKATMALTLTFALIFSRPFANLNPHAGSSLNSVHLLMVLAVVAAYPGKTVGGFVHNFIWSSLGLFGGVAVFVILATLCYAPLAQGFVFALWVYLVALVRALGPKYISFFLYGVLFAFNGIYSPIELAKQSGRLAFESSWLLAYFQAYGYGLVISLAVNFLVSPTQSSAELNTLLIASLQHISSLAHLTCKAYSKEIDADEEQVRSVLVQTIRSDYLALASRLEETAYEVRLRSQFRFVDWQDMIAKVQGLQQALITSSSALDLIDELDPEGINVKRHLLARSESAATFKAFRRGIDLVIASIVDQLLGNDNKQQQRKPTGEEDVHGQEMRERWHLHSRANQEPTLPPPATQPRTGAAEPVAGAPLSRKETMEQLMTIGDKLRREVQRSEIRQQQASRESSVSNAPTTNDPPTPEEQAQAAADLRHTLSKRTTVFDPERRTPSGDEEKAYAAGSEVGFLRDAWERFAQVQADALISLIKDGSLGIEDVLRIEEGMPGLQMMLYDRYADRLPKAWTSSLVAETSLRRIRHAVPMSSFAGSSRGGEDSAHPEEVAISAALTKSYSILFGFGQLTDELCSLHSLVTTNRKKRIRPYIFYTLRQRLLAPWQRPNGMTLPEALATLKGDPYTALKVTLTQRFVWFERWLRGDRSLYAFKVAIGASLYTVFILTPSLQTNLFFKYGMTSSLITVIVAISPTLGQTTWTWVLQLAGTGVGALYGLIVLEIFHNVGGHVYNPYGLAAAIAVWAAFSSFIFYGSPQYYTASLLMMVGSGNVVILEYLYNENPVAMATLRQPYEAPPLRFAHLIGSMGISIGISAILQLFFLRSPARRQLRKEIATITSSLARYNTLLQTLINVVAPADDAPMPSPEALDQIADELVQQEIAIQSALLKLPTTYGYAKVEPTFGLPFKADVLLKIINSHQIILDRLREARTAVGTRGFNETVHKDFASALFPYRLHSQRLARVLFHLAATSLMCKTPLARDVPSSKPTWASFENDALVLSRRLSQLPRGEAELKRPGFLRYWFYLVSLGSVSSELENLEQYLGELFDDPHMISDGVL
ncbi:BZ3500_MvSof-1268-A1-R1_Chr1-3g02359 [Microbotryum saponariae]|uniref:BZ3500_MvSof-1268-A1-R1_Chr1-3g02359 protein n=1 Tax=Microbotryum saponariae TaxID=289078 RepID=A0A2X0KW82_9BASI|nr:BZ3500_MvSof-1268-A1-R1_Chr1-3g02359 [Microbotryum saponariae]SCZ96096.1 BZ3501_MvSof-1269-A2-R1_Chr1-3g01962 [Microbotryum saponariae]